MPKLVAAPAALVNLEPKDAPRLVTGVRCQQALEEYARLSAKVSQMEARKKELGKEICELYHARFGKRIETDEYLSTEVPGKHVTVSAAKLAQAGVAPSVIAEATIETTYSYPKVTRKPKTRK